MVDRLHHPPSVAVQGVVYALVRLLSHFAVLLYGKSVPKAILFEWLYVQKPYQIQLFCMLSVYACGLRLGG